MSEAADFLRHIEVPSLDDIDTPKSNYLSKAAGMNRMGFGRDEDLLLTAASYAERSLASQMASAKTIQSLKRPFSQIEPVQMRGGPSHFPSNSRPNHSYNHPSLQPYHTQRPLAHHAASRHPYDLAPTQSYQWDRRDQLPSALMAPPSSSSNLMSMMLPTPPSSPAYGGQHMASSSGYSPRVGSMATPQRQFATQSSPSQSRPMAPPPSLEQAMQVLSSFYGVDPLAIHEFSQAQAAHQGGHRSKSHESLPPFSAVEDINQLPQQSLDPPPSARLHAARLHTKSQPLKSAPVSILPAGSDGEEQFPDELGDEDELNDEDDGYAAPFDRYLPEGFGGNPRRQVGTDDADRKYSCESCGKRYKQKSHLLVHKRTHDGVRPFVCDFEPCGKSFVTNSALRAHLRVHSGERPYLCGFDGCGRMFSTNSNLRRHERTHTSTMKGYEEQYP